MNLARLSITESLLDRVARGLDAAVMVRLGRSDFPSPSEIDLAPADPLAFWADSHVHDPGQVRAVREYPGGAGCRELRLEAPSDGQGDHPGARKLIATAHVRDDPTPAPMVLILHGFAVPVTTWDAWQARRLRAQGAHTVRLDLPYHLRRRIPGRRSGDGFFGIDPAHIRSSVRQAVEDAAALVAWARREVTPTVTVLGVSLGGLIATLLASQVELDAVVAVAPFCDPPHTLMQQLPVRTRRRIGIEGRAGSRWGDDTDSAQAAVDAALAPLVPRTMIPATPAERVTLVRPANDRIVGAEPIGQLAEAWGAQLWDFRHSHITIVNARGLAARMHEQLLAPTAVSLTGRAAVPAGRR